MTECPPERPSALLVDDNTLVLRAMTMLFDSVGWAAFEAGSADQALEQIKAKDYDVAVIDIKMPDIDGIELCRQMQKQNQRKAPIVFLHSGYIDAKRHQEALRAGVHGFLNKPIGRSELIDALKKFGLPCQD